MLDRKLHLLAPAVPGTSNPARGSTAAGGVARNVAENLALLGQPVALVAAVGDDDAGARLRGRLASLGVDVTAVRVAPGTPTAEYTAVLDPRGQLVLGVADMAVLDLVSVPDVDAAWPERGWVFADCNLAPEVLAHVLRRGLDEAQVRVAVDAVSTPKVTRLPADLTGLDLLFCNQDEARAVLAAGPVPGGARPVDAALARGLRAAGAGRVVLTRGAQGVLLADDRGEREIAAVPARVVDVTGAGDALVAGTLSGLLDGQVLDGAVALGTLVAALTVASGHSVRPDLSAQLIASASSAGPEHREQSG